MDDSLQTSPAKQLKAMETLMIWNVFGFVAAGRSSQVVNRVYAIRNGLTVSDMFQRIDNRNSATKIEHCNCCAAQQPEIFF